MAEQGAVTESQIYPYPGATRSVVWKYFGFTKKKESPPSKQNLDMAVFICKLCRKSYANKGKQKNDSFAPGHARGHFIHTLLFCAVSEALQFYL